MVELARSCAGPIQGSRPGAPGARRQPYRAQRPAGAAPAVDATAEDLPFDDDSFDAVTATVTIHQWRDVEQGLREMRRVSRGLVVVLTVDAPALRPFWLTDYIPEVAVPRDCSDGFGDAFFARPEAFLQPDVRAATSGLVLTGRAPGCSPPRHRQHLAQRPRRRITPGHLPAKVGLRLRTTR